MIPNALHYFRGIGQSAYYGKAAMRRAFVSVFVLLAVAAMAAPLLAAGHPLTALLIRGFFSRICHQQVARSFVIAGAPAAVCVRCLGIYCGAALGALAGISTGRRVLGFALLLNAIDVATAMLYWHGDLPPLRFCFGLLLGWSAGALLACRCSVTIKAS